MGGGLACEGDLWNFLCPLLLPYLPVMGVWNPYFKLFLTGLFFCIKECYLGFPRR